MEATSERKADAHAHTRLVETKSRSVRGYARSGTRNRPGNAKRSRCCMKFALVNPNWNFKGSTYFGCHDSHYPLELLFAFDRIRESGHEPLLIDAQNENLTTDEAKRKVDA